MRIEFPEHVKVGDLQDSHSLEDLRVATNEQLDMIRDLIESLPDSYVSFEPVDHDAHDEYAADEADVELAWTLGHVVLHATASSEEGAARGSMLARGVEVSQRMRYEPDWQTISTVEELLHRLEESRRIRLAFLDTWPGEPHLEIKFAPAKWFIEHYGVANAIGATLAGLQHEFGHIVQMEEVIRQAREALGD